MNIKNFVKKQVISITPKLYTRHRYRKIMGRELNTKNPITYTEKIFCFIMYNKNPIFTRCADKIAVRDYLREKLPNANSLFTHWYFTTDDIDSISKDSLPKQFVLKSNHASGQVMLCVDKESFDLEKAKKILIQWMKSNHYYAFGEQHYKNIKPQIICEELLTTDIVDYRIFCMGGKPVFTRVTKHDKRAKLGYAVGTYDIEWNPLDLLAIHDDVELKTDKPKRYEEMLSIATVIAKDFDFVRVDLYEVDDKIYFAELTFTPNGGMYHFRNMEWDLKLGELIPGDLKH